MGKIYLRVLTSVILLLSFSVVNAQFEGFYQTYDGPYGERAKEIIKTIDGGYAMVGFFAHFDFDSILLVKTDVQGIEEWRKTYGGPLGYATADNIAEMPDGGFIIYGDVNEQVGLATLRDGYLIRTNPVGDVMWTKNLGTENVVQSSNDIIITGDGHILASIGTILPGDDKYDIEVTKMTLDGDIIWNKTYGEFGIGENGNGGLHETEEGNYVIAGSITTETVSDRDILLMQIDSQGELMWKSTPSITNDAAADYDYTLLSYEGVHDVTIDNEGNIVVSGASSSFETGIDEMWSHSIMAAKFDSEGNLIWINAYDTDQGGQAYGYAITATEAGEYLITGSRSISGGSGMPIFKIDSDGNVVFRDYYGDPNALWRGFSIIQGEENKYLIAGLTDMNRSSCAFLLEIDENELVSSNITEPEERDITELDIFPNPTTGFLNINNNSQNNCEVSIHSIAGYPVYRGLLHRGNNVINLTGNNSGIYILKVNSDNYSGVFKLILSQ